MRSLGRRWEVVYALRMGLDLVQDRASCNGSELNSTFSLSYVSSVVLGFTKLVWPLPWPFSFGAIRVCMELWAWGNGKYHLSPLACLQRSKNANAFCSRYEWKGDAANVP